tara:strand:- start:24 stop:524 length:501 start_codon:yes stop_codon:yes gene_type:complete
MERKILYKMGNVFSGRYIKKEYLEENGKILYLSYKHLINDSLNINLRTSQFINYVEKQNQKFLAQPGDIVISRFMENRIIYTFNKNDPKCFINDKWFLIRPENKDYLNKYFKIKKFRKKFEADCHCFMVGAMLPSIKLEEFKEIEILIVPEKELDTLYEKQRYIVS